MEVLAAGKAGSGGVSGAGIEKRRYDSLAAVTFVWEAKRGVETSRRRSVDAA